MNGLVQKITEINNVVNTWIWTDFGLYLLLIAGVIMTIVTGVFQITHLRHWWTNTIVTVFKKDNTSTKKTFSTPVPTRNHPFTLTKIPENKKTKDFFAKKVKK